MPQVPPPPQAAAPRPDNPIEALFQRLIPLWGTKPKAPEAIKEALAEALSSGGTLLRACHQWDLQGAEPRYVGTDPSGNQRVIVGTLPPVGTVVEFAGSLFYIAEHSHD